MHENVVSYTQSHQYSSSLLISLVWVVAWVENINVEDKAHCTWTLVYILFQTSYFPFLPSKMLCSCLWLYLYSFLPILLFFSCSENKLSFTILTLRAIVHLVSSLHLFWFSFLHSIQVGYFWMGVTLISILFFEDFRHLHNVSLWCLCLYPHAYFFQDPHSYLSQLHILLL